MILLELCHTLYYSNVITFWSCHMLWQHNYVTLRTKMAAQCGIFMNSNENLIGSCKKKTYDCQILNTKGIIYIRE